MQDIVYDSFAVERFVVEIVSGIGDQNKFPYEDVEDCGPILWDVVLILSVPNTQVWRYFVIFTEYFEDVFSIHFEFFCYGILLYPFTPIFLLPALVNISYASLLISMKYSNC